jgi:hypothetical protein
VLVFPPQQLVDSSFAKESIVRLGEQILKDTYGERFLLLEGLSDTRPFGRLLADSAWNLIHLCTLNVTALAVRLVFTGLGRITHYAI